MKSNITLEIQKKKREKRSRDTDGDGDGDGDAVQHQPQPLLIRYSSSSQDKKVKIKKKQKQLMPITATITKNISITRTITITTLPEDPEKNTCLYLCIRRNCDPGGRWFRWCKIDPTNQSPKSKSKAEPIALSPISYMPTTTPRDICIVASSDPGPSSKKKHKKVVYAVGGLSYEHHPDGRSRGYRSAKAFICDFGSKSVEWEELPPMSTPKVIHIGVVSPSDGKLYAFGDAAREVEVPLPAPEFKTFMIHVGTRIETIAEGDVFDPSSCSWTPYPSTPENHIPFSDIDDYTFDKEKNELIVFTDHKYLHTYDLTTLKWNDTHTVPLSPSSENAVSSSVVVGDTIYKFHLGQLYALDKTSTSPSFEPVSGLDKKVDSYLSDPECIYRAYLSYLGKGKFSLVWGGTCMADGVPPDSLFIKLLKFWVGVCNRTNRRRAIIDQREEYVTKGHRLHDCVAL